MKAILADASFLIALLHAGDVHHADAAQFLKGADDVILLVTNHAFDEAMTLLKRRVGAALAIRAGESLRRSRLFQRMTLSEDDEEAAWSVFVRHGDKEWSYTDCASLAVMQRLGIAEAVSFDHHFDQMGIVRLPAVPLARRKER